MPNFLIDGFIACTDKIFVVAREIIHLRSVGPSDTLLDRVVTSTVLYAALPNIIPNPKYVAGPVQTVTETAFSAPRWHPDRLRVISMLHALLPQKSRVTNLKSYLEMVTVVGGLYATPLSPQS